MTILNNSVLVYKSFQKHYCKSIMNQQIQNNQPQQNAQSNETLTTEYLYIFFYILGIKTTKILIIPRIQ